MRIKFFGMTFGNLDFVAFLVGLVGILLVTDGRSPIGWLLIVVAVLLALWSGWHDEAKKQRR